MWQVHFCKILRKSFLLQYQVVGNNIQKLNLWWTVVRRIFWNSLPPIHQFLALSIKTAITQNIIYLIPLHHKTVISASSLGQDWQKSWLYK